MKEEPLSFDELQLFNRRELIIRSVLAIPFSGIVWRLWNLQIERGETFLELSKGNRIRLRSEAAPRGIIYDRNGVILAKNIPSYTLQLVKEDVVGVSITEVLIKISTTLKIPLQDLLAAVKSNKKIAKFNPIPIYEDLSHRQIALIESYQEEFPGISIENSPRRYYPLMKTGSHLSGYMNQITKAQLKLLPTKKIKSAKLVGQDGVEAIYNDELIGTDGVRTIEVNSIGREIREYQDNSVEQIPGNDILLTINSKLQAGIEKIMGDRKGVAIIMDPRNGEVLAMVSLPSFDPNEFSQRLTQKRWERLINDPNQSLNNMCIQGVYSPGSTFKMVVAAAGLDMGIIERETEIFCEGFLKLKRTRIHCHRRSGHGNLNVVQALEKSCNVFFYKIAMEIGIDKIQEYAYHFGLGKPTGIDLPHETSGIIPNRAWKMKRYNREWLKGETPIAAIGQGYITVTPLQLINYINVIANGGNLLKPRVVRSILKNDFSENEEGEFRKIINTPSLSVPARIDTEILDILKEGMTANVQGKHGTGRRARSKMVSIAGKTGTVQVVSNKTREKIRKEFGEIDKKYFDHGWFVSFSPVENPVISTVVLIEHGKSGKYAAELTKKIIEFYFSEISTLPSPPPENINGNTKDISIDVNST